MACGVGVQGKLHVSVMRRTAQCCVGRERGRRGGGRQRGGEGEGGRGREIRGNNTSRAELINKTICHR